MIFQIGVDLHSIPGDEVWEYVKGEGDSWEVISGMLLQERIFNNINTLYKFMRKCEDIYGGSLKFIIQPLPDEKDEPDMVYMIITDSKNN